MKRNELFVMMAIASLTIVLGCGSASAQPKPTSGDEGALRKLIEEWAAMCTVQGNPQNLEKIMADNFDGRTEGKSFKKRGHPRTPGDTGARIKSQPQQ